MTYSPWLKVHVRKVPNGRYQASIPRKAFRASGRTPGEALDNLCHRYYGPWAGLSMWQNLERRRLPEKRFMISNGIRWRITVYQLRLKIHARSKATVAVGHPASTNSCPSVSIRG